MIRLVRLATVPTPFVLRAARTPNKPPVGWAAPYRYVLWAAPARVVGWAPPARSVPWTPPQE